MNSTRVVGDAVGRPLRGRREQRLLHRVLAGVELPVPAHQRAEDLRREVTQQVLERLDHSASLGRAAVLSQAVNV
jgi:hypothetical protein